MLENMCQMTNLLFMLLCLASVYQKEAPSVAAVTQLHCFCKCLNRRCFLTEDFPRFPATILVAHVVLTTTEPPDLKHTIFLGKVDRFTI